MLNADLDRYSLADAAVDRLPQLRNHAGYFKELLKDKRLEHKAYIRAHGEDLPEIRDWRWTLDH